MRLIHQLKRLLRLDARPSASPRPAFTQPVPQVTPFDVERIVRRDFSPAEYDTVMAMLGEYGTEEWHAGPTRVQIATLKMADGSVQKLRECIEVAKRDYRDALGAAEYPAYCKILLRVRDLPDEEKNRIFDSDWRQYQEWLKR